MEELWGPLCTMYMIAGYLYMWLSPRSDRANADTRLCIWVFWLPLLIWDILKMCGKAFFHVFEAITEAFD